MRLAIKSFRELRSHITFMNVIDYLYRVRLSGIFLSSFLSGGNIILSQ
jgi:hypothetical protein